MKKTTFYPTLEEALFLHTRLLEVFGGAQGVRDMGLLESALARPKSGYYESLTEQAAALMHSIAMNHCFIDGNKRVAFALADVFLRLNGYSFVVNVETAEEFIIQHVIKKKCELKSITLWISKYSKAL